MTPDPPHPPAPAPKSPSAGSTARTVTARGAPARDSTLPSILLIEDAPDMAALYAAYLRKAGFGIEIATTGHAAMDRLEVQPRPDLVLVDLNLPDMDGMDILRRVAEGGYSAGIVITAHGSVNVAVEAMRSGADDFLVKPFNGDRLVVTVRNTLERRRLARLVDTYREDYARERYRGFIGASRAMRAIYRIIENAASSRATCFITGESGTGKEVCAQAIHQAGPRRDGPFVALNCGAVPRDLIESEIFGHVRGAFTGATSDRPGAARRADGGTLFLDEVCEMDGALQTKLLRFLQTGTVQPVGANASHAVDLRIICATNRDPMAEVRAGRFREDLYYRLHVIPIHMPPLREREEDALLLSRALLSQYAAEEGRRFTRFAPEVERALLTCPWPGNVRQLQNVIRQAVVLNDGEVLTAAMLPPLDRAMAPVGAVPSSSGSAVSVPHSESPRPRAPTEVGGPEDGPEGGPERLCGAAAATPDPTVRPLWQVERDTIEAAVAACNGNIQRAAQLLEISPSTIYRKRVQWDRLGDRTGPDDMDAPSPIVRVRA